MRDAIVIGAGFAGCAAARELRRAGRDVLILEARDRIGGRTWTDDWDGVRIERGGGWVHWFQPHVWSEVTANGLTPVVGPATPAGVWSVGDERRSGPSTERSRLAARGWAAFTDGSHDALPQPHRPLLHPDRIAPFDRLSIAERLEALDLSDEERDVLRAELMTLAHGPLDESGALSVLRWHALSGHDFDLAVETGGAVTIAEGTHAILAPIHRAAAAETRLATPVTAIEQEPGRVVVTTADGAAHAARAVVVAVPLNALGAIAMDVSEVKREAIALGQPSRGAKVHLRVDGDPTGVNALHHARPIGHVSTQQRLPGGDDLLIAFGADHAAVAVDDLGALQRQLDATLPGRTVRAATAHDWVDDPWSRGTWAVHRPGWYARFHAEMQRPEDRLLLAGSDLADGWAGFIDGALESGIRAGRWAAALD